MSDFMENATDVSELSRKLVEKNEKIKQLQSDLTTANLHMRKMAEALEIAWRDILDWEATAKGLRELTPKQLNVMIKGTERGEKESEKVRHKIHKALSTYKEAFPS